MKIPFGKFKGIDISLIASGYLQWLMKQDWFIDKDDDLVVAVEKELADRDRYDEHFWKDKVRPTAR